MLAVAGYLDRKNAAPPELIIGLDWTRFGLPYAAGGLRDQPMRLFRRMKQALTFYEALTLWKNKYTPTPEANERWHRTHAWVVDIVNELTKIKGTSLPSS